jgi:hypothetical protein
VPAPVPYANFSNPQTLNLYAMVHDDPETFADLDGHGQNGNCALNNPCTDQNPNPSSPSNVAKNRAQKHHHHPPNTRREVDKLYNEFSGIRPKPGATTEPNRSQAVVNAAHVYDNVNGRGFQGSSLGA